MNRLSMPFFSVVVPVYNKIKHLERTLECLYSQSYRDFEIVVVDDGSTDGSLQLLDAHRERGLIRLYRRYKPGPGGYEARNHGARRALGKWLIFQDADDWCSEDHLEEFHHDIERTNGSDIKLYVNAYAKVRNGTIVPIVAFPHDGVLSRKQGLELFSRADYIHMNGVCIERQLFLKSSGFPEGRYRRGGDVYYWIRMLASEDKSHYSRKITSHWNNDNSQIIKNPVNLPHIHPAKDALMEMRGEFGWIEAYYAKRAINRKLISWAVQKKTYGMFFHDDLMALCFYALTVKQAIYCMILLLPRDVFAVCRSLGQGLK
ncbi:glycosyltransferase family 2 protein [Billgrantia azerbaijanica]|nr:glycosyltransferase family 2 protein [Halomonas azerbaijanica]